MFSRRVFPALANGIKQTTSKRANIHTFAKTATKSQKFVTTAAVTAGAATLWYLYNTVQSENNGKEGFSLFPTVHADEEHPNIELVQPTVISGMHPHCAIVTIHLSPNANRKEVAKAAGKLQDIVNKISPSKSKDLVAGIPQSDSGEIPAVLAGVGFSLPYWKALKSASIKDYEARKGTKFGDMPATGGDLILHVKGATRSLCYETVEEFLKALPTGAVKSVEDHYGFQYKDGRDLSGFLDGTMNPSDVDTRYDAGVISNTGGAFLIHQVWHHELEKFGKLAVKTQEEIIGRSKPDSTELSKLSIESHVARMRQKNGDLIPIVRQSMPFGSVQGPRGLLFIAYSNNLDKFNTMLDRMTGKDGNSDAIMSFSRCVTGNYWYIPSLRELSSI